jgi:hypothetical protein
MSIKKWQYQKDHAIKIIRQVFVETGLIALILWIIGITRSSYHAEKKRRHFCADVIRKKDSCPDLTGAFGGFAPGGRFSPIPGLTSL